MSFKKKVRKMVLILTLFCSWMLLGNHSTALAENQYYISKIIVSGSQYSPGDIDLGSVQSLNFNFGFLVNQPLSQGSYRARILINDPRSGNPEKTINITGSSVDFGQIPLSGENSSYQIVVSLLSQEGDDYVVADNISFLLTVGQLDTAAPTVRSAIPANGAFNLPIDTIPLITINEPVKESLINSNTIYLQEKSTGAKVSSSLTFNTENDRTLISLSPTANLKYGTAYTIEIPEGGLKDLAGNGIAGFNSEFTTIADPNANPILISRNPGVNATNVSINTEINLNVSKQLNPSTINANSIYLQKGNSKVPITIVVSNTDGQGQIAISPLSNLDYNSTYTVVIASNLIKDLNGKALAGSSWSFTTQNSPVTIITSCYPGAGSSAIPVDSWITAQFSGSLNSATVNSSTIYLRHSGSSSNLPITVSYNSTNRTVTIIPSAQLFYGTEYRVYVSSNVKDANGRNLTATNWAFTTMNNDLRIIERTPDSWAANVPVNTDIRLKFSTNMRAATINSSTIYLRRSGSSSNISATVSYNSSTRTVVLTPGYDLEYDKIYTVYVTGGVQDSGYNPLSPLSWSFTTASEQYVRITGRSPGINATNVPVDTNITISFSRAIDSATINNNTVYLCPEGTNSKIAANLSYNSSSRLVTLTPVSKLQYNTAYLVYVDGVRDSQYYYLSRTNWKFTTTAGILPAVSSSDPKNGQSSVPVTKGLSIKFNRSMDKNTVNNSNIYLRNLKTGASLPATVSYDHYNCSATITPTVSMDYNTGYVMYLIGVKDSDGNLLELTSITFNTEAEPLRRGSSASPLVKINGKYVNFTDIKPYIKNDRIFIPFRALVETIGANVGFNNSNPKKMRVWAVLGSNKIELTVGEKIAYRNGLVLTMDVAPELKNDRTMIPLRFAVEALDKKVSWDGLNYTAILGD